MRDFHYNLIKLFREVKSLTFIDVYSNQNTYKYIRVFMSHNIKTEKTYENEYRIIMIEMLVENR